MTLAVTVYRSGDADSQSFGEEIFIDVLAVEVDPVLKAESATGSD